MCVCMCVYVCVCTPVFAVQSCVCFSCMFFTQQDKLHVLLLHVFYSARQAACASPACFLLSKTCVFALIAGQSCVCRSLRYLTCWPWTPQTVWNAWIAWLHRKCVLSTKMAVCECGCALYVALRACGWFWGAGCLRGRSWGAEGSSGNAGQGLRAVHHRS
jgi:hypothetical protein